MSSKSYIFPIMMVSTLFSGIFYNVKTVKENTNRSEVAMEYLKKHDSNKYVEILEKGLDKSRYSTVKEWEQAAGKVKDSLRIDSIAKSNYAKGVQMVRDSIANVNLNDTARTVIKSIK